MKWIKPLLILILFSTLFSEDDLPPNRYLFADFGLGYAHIKDTGTSPLRYHGLYSNAEFAFKSIGNAASFSIQGEISYSAAFAAQYSVLNYIIGNFKLEYLRSLSFQNLNDLRLRLGAVFDASASGAINSDLQNATLNVDYLFDLMLSSQFDYDFILKGKKGKFLFFNYNYPDKAFRAFFKLDLPMMILNGRPEFAYLNPVDMDYFSRRYFLGGFKMGTELGIKGYLPNGNIIEFKYDWDMYTSGNRDIYLLERASHNFTLAFYFKMN